MSLKVLSSHTIVVKIDQPIQQVLQKPDLARKMVTCLGELSGFDIRYEPKTVIKAQALIDFLLEMIDEEGIQDSSWMLYVDGALNAKSCGARVILEKE